MTPDAELICPKQLELFDKPEPKPTPQDAEQHRIDALSDPQVREQANKDRAAGWFQGSSGTYWPRPSTGERHDDSF